ncbi:MAG: DUF1211 domain-containing protein [Bacteroidota bacterium]|jgi:uncharacterized membrane protein|nr:DUF1211 domain-containing protein [Bacteroidota bacterium]
MGKGRMEAFSDGVIAIIITIMVLELKVPHSASFSALQDIWPVLLSYILSFIYIGIYWSNHHHLLQAVAHVNGKILWANLHLLFWLSLVPFASGWMGENHFENLPVVLYGFVLLMNAIAYYILVRTLIGLHGRNDALAIAIGKDIKGKISVYIYMIAIAIGFWYGWMALFLYGVVAVIWMVPDRRIEKKIILEGK